VTFNNTPADSNVVPFVNTTASSNTGITVTSSGIYDIYFMVNAYAILVTGAPSSFYVQLFVNGTATNRAVYSDAGEGTNISEELSLDTLMSLNAGDTLTVRVNSLISSNSIVTNGNGINSELKVMRIA
jgi:hypothetical protein